MSEGMWADDEQERHPITWYLKVAKTMTQMALAEEVKELRDWKESAIVQLRKSEKLHEYLREHGDYLGWDVYDAALDLLKRDCPCCGFPHCGHKHKIKSKK